MVRRLPAPGFVENRAVLSAEPEHRSAFRGALALLDQKAIPELGDVAAIFTLVVNSFEGRLTQSTGDSPPPPSDNNTRTAEEGDSPKLPLWPPQEASPVISSTSSIKHLGHLHWCQKVLWVFLKESPSTETEIHNISDLNGDSEDDEAEQGEEMVKERERLHSATYRIWDEARDAYVSLQN